jgi:hypothetical protein
MDIEKKLNPKNGKLIKKNNCVTATLFDNELDELQLSFDYSMSVTINTENFNTINLSYSNLFDMIELIEESEIYFDKKFNKNK